MIKKTAFVFLTITLLVSCSTSRNVSGVAFDKNYQTESSNASSAQSAESELENQQRMIIYNAEISIYTKIPDSVNIHLTAIANKYEGYVQALGNKKSVIRVKADKLNKALTDISALGKVKSRTVSGNDVTERYTDLQIRLENAYKARNRYFELLSKAENVEAGLKVEKELERLNGVIDTLEGQMKRLQHLSVLSTINIDMGEKVKPGILGYVGLGLFKSIKWLIVRN